MIISGRCHTVMGEVVRKGNVMKMSYPPKRGCEVMSCSHPTVLGKMPKSDQEVKTLKISATLHHVGQRLPERNHPWQSNWMWVSHIPSATELVSK